jgi:hypothetical protein
MRRTLAISGIILVVLLALAGTCSAAYVNPVLVDDNPSCGDLGCIELYKVDPPVSGTYTSGDFTVTVTIYASVADGEPDTVDWTSNSPVTMVIVKGGDYANVYEYPGGSTGDTGLTAPYNENSGKNYAVSHVSFCGTTTNVPEFPAEFLPVLGIAGLSAILIFSRKN